MTHVETNEAWRKVAKPVPDKPFTGFAGRKLFMPILNRKSARIAHSANGQDFGFKPNFGRGIGPRGHLGPIRCYLTRARRS